VALVVDPDADELWASFGSHPFLSGWGSAQQVESFDGVTWTVRGTPLTFPGDVSALLAVSDVECDAGSPQVAECAGLTEVVLDGSGTRVSPGVAGAVEHVWTGPFVEGTARGVSPTVHFEGVGSHDVELVVTAGSGSASCATRVEVVDTRPPVVTPASDPLACLWPPNHRLVSFSTSDLAPSLVDGCSQDVRWVFADCASSEPDDGLGDGRTGADCVVSDDGLTLTARAERQGLTPTGRRYAVRIIATDASGNATAPAWIGDIVVPHDAADVPCGGR
jgi:hypothetical protein